MIMIRKPGAAPKQLSKKVRLLGYVHGVIAAARHLAHLLVHHQEPLVFVWGALVYVVNFHLLSAHPLGLA